MKKATPTFLAKLAKLRSEEIIISKDKEAYGYKYAPLDTILPIIEPLMQKHGLWYFHTNKFDRKSWKNVLETTIYEIVPFKISEAEQFVGSITSKTLIDDEVVLAKMNKYMVIGSAITYFRRYHLVSMLGLLTDEDTDAGAVRGGRSVESKAPKSNLVDNFKKVLPSKKTKSDAMKLFNTHKHNFTDAQSEEVLNLINKQYEGK